MNKKNIFALVAAFSFGFVVAFVVVDRGSGTAEREPEAKEAPPDRLGSPPKPIFSQAAPRPLDASPQFSDIHPAESDEAGSRPTPEERAVMSELARRARAGEYLLGSDNPFTERVRRENLQKGMETTVPRVMAVRQAFLSNLDVAEESIAKLTNHAARIAEASLAVAPLLAEISGAKVEYDLKAREVLGPEQYDKLKEFETRQALEKEWRRFDAEGVENLSLGDLNGITRSMEELGIRERTSSTILPYEPEPSSGNWITGPETKLEEVMASKVARVDAAAADFPAVAERNQLSDEARQTMASMIESRRRSLREQLNRSPNAEQQERDFLKRMESRLGRPLK